MEINMKYKLAIINGSNMNILGLREPKIYGTKKWEDIWHKLSKISDQMEIELIYYQSNHEGDLVDFLQMNLEEIAGVVINPAAFTKTGYSILDTLTARPIPFVGLHMSNIVASGGWHSESIFTNQAVGLIIGFGDYVYELGLEALYHTIIQPFTDDKS